jgi:hypothetical protein
MKINSKKIGEYGVLKVAVKLNDAGISSSFPIGDYHRYDLILERNGMFARAQVKSRKSRNGILYISFWNKSTNNGKNTQKRYHPGQIEAFIIYNPLNDSIYIVPPEMLLQKKSIWLRLEPPKSNQKKGIQWAYEYENNLGNIRWIYR